MKIVSFKSKPEPEIKVGDRILYRFKYVQVKSGDRYNTEPLPDLSCETVKEISPSGLYINLSLDGGTAWVERKWLKVIEVLPKDE